MFRECPRQCNEFENSVNINAHFIAPNPPTSFNRRSVCPAIDSTAFVGSFSTVIGDVTICNNCFIAPNVSIRADEGLPFLINSNSNIQDGCVLCSLTCCSVVQEGRKYSIYIGRNVSCTPGCIIQGPCKLCDNVFAGSRCTISNCIVGRGCFISQNCLLTGNITICPNRFVPPGAIIDTQAKADCLRMVSERECEFAREVQRVNSELAQSYSSMSRECRWGCGVSN